MWVAAIPRPLGTATNSDSPAADRLQGAGGGSGFSGRGAHDGRTAVAARESDRLVGGHHPTGGDGRRECPLAQGRAERAQRLLLLVTLARRQRRLRRLAQGSRRAVEV